MAVPRRSPTSGGRCLARSTGLLVADLPAPRATRGVSNPPTLVPRPAGALPKTLPGYVVSEYASGLDNPRLIRTAPNGDLFVAESQPGRVKVLRGRGATARRRRVDVREGLNQPFGIAFYPPGPNPSTSTSATPTRSCASRTRTATSRRAARPKTIVPTPGGRQRGGGHWTRDIAFSPDGKKLFVSVGSLLERRRPDVNAAEKDRAAILEFNPDGTGRRVYASGIRNPVGLAIHPKTGQLWASVNERDDLGDNLVPDYITHVEDGGFYGWPWYYIGGNQDPRHEGKHPELKDKVIVPDVLHPAAQRVAADDLLHRHAVPAEHRDSIFAAEHGSWNRRRAPATR